MESTEGKLHFSEQLADLTMVMKKSQAPKEVSMEREREDQDVFAVRPILEPVVVRLIQTVRRGAPVVKI